MLHPAEMTLLHMGYSPKIMAWYHFPLPTHRGPNMGHTHFFITFFHDHPMMENCAPKYDILILPMHHSQ